MPLSLQATCQIGALESAQEEDELNQQDNYLLRRIIFDKPAQTVPVSPQCAIHNRRSCRVHRSTGSAQGIGDICQQRSEVEKRRGQKGGGPMTTDGEMTRFYQNGDWSDLDAV